MFEVDLWLCSVVQKASPLMHSRHKAYLDLLCLGCHEAMLLHIAVQSLYPLYSFGFPVWLSHSFPYAGIKEGQAHVLGAPVEPALPRRASLFFKAVMWCRTLVSVECC